MVLRPDWRTFAAHSRTWHRNCWCNAQAPRRPNWTTVCAWTRGARCWHEARGPIRNRRVLGILLGCAKQDARTVACNGPPMGLQCFGRNGIPHLLGPSPQVAAMAVPTVHQIIQCHAAWVALSAVPAHAVHQPCDHFARWRVGTHQGPGLLRKIVFAPKPRDILFDPFRIRRIPPRVHRTRRPRRQQEGKLGGTRKGSTHRHILADTACT